MSTWWPGQDFCPGTPGVLMVGCPGNAPINLSAHQHSNPFSLQWLPSDENISRIPKELISRFVKICPTCQVRRRGSRLTPPSSRRESPQLEPASRSPTDLSPPVSRRQSVVSRQTNLDRLQTHMLRESRSQGDWQNVHQQIHEQQGESHGMPSFPTDVLHTIPTSIASPLDPPRSDLPLIQPQLRYNHILVRNGGDPNQRPY